MNTSTGGSWIEVCREGFQHRSGIYIDAQALTFNPDGKYDILMTMTVDTAYRKMGAVECLMWMSPNRSLYTSNRARILMGLPAPSGTPTLPGEFEFGIALKDIIWEKTSFRGAPEIKSARLSHIVAYPLRKTLEI